MIRLSNGHSFEYVAASGALGFRGEGRWPERFLGSFGFFEPSLFTPVIKTLTLRPNRGNPVWRWVRLIPGGVVNAVRLANPGIERWCREIGPTIDSRKIPVVASVFGEPEELAEMACVLNEFDFVGLEINESCPNTETDILRNTAKVISGCQAVRENSRLPILVKLSVSHDVERITKEIGGAAEALSINSVPWRTVFPNRRSPLERWGGGAVSGKAAQPFTWDLVRKLADMTPIPVIGPSVWDFGDMEKVRSLGAKAVSFGSIFLRYPWRPTLFVLRERKLKQSMV